MAYPIITDWFRCQAILHFSSGLATDVAVNNWYFRNDNAVASRDDIASDMKNVLDAFYGQTNGTAIGPVASWISNEVTSVTYKVYDLGEATPRYPIVPPLAGSWVGGAAGAPVLPREVSCVMSFRSGDGPRRRGRVYLGPFHGNATASASGGGARPDGSLVDAIGQSAVNVLNSTENVSWGTVSPTAGEGHLVVEASVDDAWDTQRSRGREPTSRRRWNASGEVV